MLRSVNRERFIFIRKEIYRRSEIEYRILHTPQDGAFSKELRSLVDAKAIYLAYMPLYYMVGTLCTNRIVSIPYPPNKEISEFSKTSDVFRRPRSVFCAFQVCAIVCYSDNNNITKYFDRVLLNVMTMVFAALLPNSLNETNSSL